MQWKTLFCHEKKTKDITKLKIITKLITSALAHDYKFSIINPGKFILIQSAIVVSNHITAIVKGIQKGKTTIKRNIFLNRKGNNEMIKP